MTSTTLRAVTLQTVANYAQAAERAVGAYRLGGQRLIAALQRGVDLAAQNGPERLAGALRRAGGNVSGLASKGLDVVSSRTERAIEAGSTGVTQQLSRVADLVEGVDIPVVSNSLQAAARISLPGAQAALALSQRVAAGADKLPGSPVARAGAKAGAQARAGAARARKAAAPVLAQAKAELKAAAQPRKTARKPAAVAAKPTLKAVAKPVKAAVKAAVTTTTTAARRAAKTKPVAAAVAAVAAVQDAIAA